MRIKVSAYFGESSFGRDLPNDISGFRFRLGSELQGDRQVGSRLKTEIKKIIKFINYWLFFRSKVSLTLILYFKLQKLSKVILRLLFSFWDFAWINQNDR